MKRVPSAPAFDALERPPRHLARDVLVAVSHKASAVTSSIKSSSAVFKFGIETVEKLVSPAKSFTVQKVRHF